MIARVHRAWLIALVATGVLGGCGAATHIATPPAGRAPSASSPAAPELPGDGSGGQTVPTPGPTGVPAATTAVSVIRGWSDALRQGDVRAAARYFALPSVMINGTDSAGGALVITIDTRAQAEAANATLPCGARFISADQRGRYVNALFRLTGRPGLGGGGCGTGSGQTARTNFEIAHGRIVEWIRAPDDPGDNGGAAPPAPPTPTVPSAPQTPGPNI